MSISKKEFIEKYDLPKQRKFWLVVKKVEQKWASGDIEEDFRLFYLEFCRPLCNRDFSEFEWDKEQTQEAIRLANDITFGRVRNAKNKDKCRVCQEHVNLEEENSKSAMSVIGPYFQMEICKIVENGEYICQKCQ